MKKLFLSVALMLAVGTLAMAQATKAPEAAKPAEKAAEAKPAAKPAMKTHKVEAEVVSADVEKKTITFKFEGAEKTAPVGPLAMYRLKKVKAGDKVTLTCRDDEKGEHQMITFIKVAGAEAAPAEKKAATPEKKPAAPKP